MDEINKHVTKILQETDVFIIQYEPYMRVHGWRFIYYLQMNHKRDELAKMMQEAPIDVYMKEFCLITPNHYHEGIRIAYKYGEPLLLAISHFLHTDIESVIKNVPSPDDNRPSKRRKSI